MSRAERRTMLRGWAVDLAWVTTIGAFLGLLGPFGSFFNGPAWQRVLYWVAMAWLGLIVYGGGMRLILSRLKSPWAIGAALTAMVLVVSVPFGVASWLVATTIWPVLRGLPHLTPWVWYLEGLTITAPQVAGFALLVAHRRRAARIAVQAATSPGLLGVPAHEVLCLQMEDHYVRVHTAAGSRLVLATMAQAIAALGRAPGLRVHRSWWVAEKAVADAVAEGRNLRLVLVNGLRAPVARSSVAALRGAGWLREPAEVLAAERISESPERPLSQLR